MSLINSNTPQGWKTTGAERKSYYVYFTGQNIFYALVSSCLTTYFAFIGLNPLKIAGVMLVIIVILLLIKPSDETLEDLDKKVSKKAKKKK